MSVFALGSLALAGCANDTLAQQYRDGNDKRYISGDGTVTEIQDSERSTPIVADDIRDLDDAPLSLPLANAEVTVVNFWYAGCAPCRAEADDLAAVSEESSDLGAVFLGINVRDTAPTAQAFVDDYQVPYQNVVDTDGNLQFAFAGEVAPNAVPTTIVLDSKGRVASRVLGVVEPDILRALIRSANDSTSN